MVWSHDCALNQLPCCCSVAKSVPTLCDTMDCSTPGFPVLHCLPEFAQTQFHELVMTSNHLILCHPPSLGKCESVSCSVVTPWTVALQAPLSMGFSRQEYWSGLPFSSPGDLPHPGVEPRSLSLQIHSLPSELWRKPRMGYEPKSESCSVVSNSLQSHGL